MTVCPRHKVNGNLLVLGVSAGAEEIRFEILAFGQAGFDPLTVDVVATRGVKILLYLWN